jgi:hypothetical protein
MGARHPFKSQPRDERAHAVIEHYVARHGVDSGHELPIDFPDHYAANEGRLSVRRGARHYGIRCAAWVTDHEDGTAVMTFQLWSPERARQHVYKQAAGDPKRLKYNPYARGVARSYDPRGG